MSEIDVRLIDGQAEETVLNRIAEIEAGAYSVPWDAASLADTLRYDHNFVILAYDGENIAGYLIFNLIMDQIEFCNLMILNKTDLLNKEQLRLRGVFPAQK